MKFTKVLFLCVSVLLAHSLAAQTLGTLTGVITDSETGEVLIGANVLIAGTTIGGATDLEGRYVIQAPPGIYSVTAGYIGYESSTLEDIRIAAGTTENLDFQLASESLEGEEVEVVAKREEGSQLEAVTQKLEALEMQDNLSSEQISKAGDSNVADAVRRVTGVTIADDKYLVVRGLGDRYSSAQLNAVTMPSPEPEKRAVPLDLFSTSLIEAIDVAKSYRPDLPGTFGGGNVNIRTKIYPDRTIYRLKVGSGLAGNLAPGGNFVRNVGGKNDFFGFDGGMRAIPEQFDDSIVRLTCCPPDFAPNLLDDMTWTYDTTYSVFGMRVDSSLVPNADSLAYREQLWKETYYPQNLEFAKMFSSKVSKAGLPASLGLTFGTKKQLNRDLEGGFLFDGNYSGKYDFREEEQIRYAVRRVGWTDGVFDSTQILIPDDIQLHRQRYNYSTNMGLNASTGIAYRDMLKLSFRSIYTHTSKDEFNSYTGRSGEIDEDGLFVNQKYDEKSINMNTWSLNASGNTYGWFHDVEAKYTLGRSVLYEPYVIKHQYQLDHGTGLFELYARNAVEPAEIYSSVGYEKISGFAYDHHLTSRFGEFKFGARLDHKDREFERRQLIIDFSSTEASNDSSNLFIEDIDAVGSQFFNLAGSENGGLSEGFIFTEQTSTGKGTRNTDAYDAVEKIDAYYLMYNNKQLLNERMQISFGVRNENYELEILPRHPVTDYRPFYTVELEAEDGSTYRDTTYLSFAKEENNWLPAATLNYIASDKLKLRTSYSKTLARAQFREYAPYEYQPFFLANVAVGYPFLKNTTLQSYDLRTDYNPRGIETMSATLFYKTFENPIEESIVAAFGRSFYQTWQNAIDATIIGTELEVRKNLDFLVPIDYGFLFLNTNLTLSNSDVSAPDSSVLYVVAEGNSAPDEVNIFNRVTDKQRPLQGQSNIVFNMSFNYRARAGYELNLAYNTFSKRLVALSGDVAGSYWEMPFHSLNFVAKQKFGPVVVDVKLKNLLNDQVVIGHLFEDEIYPTTEYRPGRTFSVGVTYSN